MTGKPVPSTENVLRVLGYLLIPAGVLILDWKHYVLGVAVLVLAATLWLGPASIRAARRERGRVRKSGSSVAKDTDE